MDDVGTGCYKFLSTCPDVTSLLGSFDPADPITANAGMPWLFTDTSTGVLTRMEGTSQCAIVCSDFGGWSVPGPGSTASFRRLRVDMWVDPLRDGTNNVMESSSETTNRGLALWAAVRFRLQRVEPILQTWGDLVTNACTVLTEPQFEAIPDGDYLQRGTAYFGVTNVGWTDYP